MLENHFAVCNKFLHLWHFHFSNKLDATENAVVSDEAQLSHSATDEPEQAPAKKKASKLRVSKKKELRSATVCY